MIEAVRRLLDNRPKLKEFIKFCLVGLSSFIIDIGLLNLLHFRIELPLLLSKTLSFLAAVTNGFFWNSRWTFRADPEKAKTQYPKFVATNLVGLVLNLSIMTGAILLATRLGYIHADREPAEILALIASGSGKQEFNKLTVNLATIVATIVVTAWNYSAAKFITFRK